MAKMVPDFSEALEFHRRADHLLHVARERQVKGKSADADDALDEVEESVEKLRIQLREEAGEEDAESNDSAYHSDD